jgi:hypothetical protein
MNSAELLAHLQHLGVELTLDDGRLNIHAPKGVLTLDLKRALKEQKSAIINLLMLPEPAQPGTEVEQLRREIGEMARAQESQWELSDELDPRWPPSLGIRNRLRPKEIPLWESEVQA